MTRPNETAYMDILQVIRDRRSIHEYPRPRKELREIAYFVAWRGVKC